jgi:hypothetical protein
MHPVVRPGIMMATGLAFTFAANFMSVPTPPENVAKYMGVMASIEAAKREYDRLPSPFEYFERSPSGITRVGSGQIVGVKPNAYDYLEFNSRLLGGTIDNILAQNEGVVTKENRRATVEYLTDANFASMVRNGTVLLGVVLASFGAAGAGFYLVRTKHGLPEVAPNTQ